VISSLVPLHLTSCTIWQNINNSRYAKVRNNIVNRSEASIKCLFFTKLPLRITNSA